MEKPFSQACENNKQPIVEVLQRVFAKREKVLEIGSGTGQHAVYCAPRLPHLVWQTSDLQENHVGINDWIDEVPAKNLKRPLAIDANDQSWPIEEKVDGIFSANTLHIMSWHSVENLFKNLGKILAEKPTVAIYGPFKYNGEFTTQSNANFDIWLKQQAPHQGVRDFEKVNQLAENMGLKLVEDNAMPANNQLLVWNKGG